MVIRKRSDQLSLQLVARCLERDGVQLIPSKLCGVEIMVQELCESRGGRPGLSVLTSLLVSVDVKNY